MRKIIKSLSLLIFVGLALFCFTACNSKNDTKPTDTDTKPTETNPTSKEETESNSLVIRIDDSKDTDSLKNTVKVTNLDTNTEVKDKDILTMDSNLNIKLFNKASDVHIRVTMDDMVVYDWFYFNQLTNNDGNEIMDLVVSGTIIIEVNTGTIPLKNYKVYYSSDVENVVIKAFWNDFDAGILPEEVPFDSGAELVEDTLICIEVTNNNTVPVMLVLYINDQVEDYTKIEANSEGHFYNRQLDGKMDLKVEQYENYTINYNALTNTTIKVYNSENTFDLKEIENGSSSIKHTSLYIEIKNNSSSKVMLTITYNDNSLVKIIDKDEEYQASNLYLEGNMTIETKTITGYSFVLNIDSSVDTELVMVNAFYDDVDGAVYLEEGDIIPTGAKVHLVVFNATESNVEVKLMFGSTTETITVGYSDSGYETNSYLITDNLTITVKQ